LKEGKGEKSEMGVCRCVVDRQNREKLREPKQRKKGREKKGEWADSTFSL